MISDKGHPMSEIHDYQVEAALTAYEKTWFKPKAKSPDAMRAALEAALSAKPPEVEDVVVTADMLSEGCQEDHVHVHTWGDPVRVAAVYRAMHRARPKVDAAKVDAPIKYQRFTGLGYVFCCDERGTKNRRALNQDYSHATYKRLCGCKASGERTGADRRKVSP